LKSQIFGKKIFSPRGSAANHMHAVGWIELGSRYGSAGHGPRSHMGPAQQSVPPNRNKSYKTVTFWLQSGNKRLQNGYSLLVN